MHWHVIIHAVCLLTCSLADLAWANQPEEHSLGAAQANKQGLLMCKATFAGEWREGFNFVSMNYALPLALRTRQEERPSPVLLTIRAVANGVGPYDT